MTPRSFTRAAGLIATAAALVPASVAMGSGASGQTPAAITVQGESPTLTNVPTAKDPRASRGAHLALDTAKAPPGRGWYATYTVRTRSAGAYRLDAVLSHSATPDREPVGGSYFALSVNGGAFAQVAKSEPYWGEAPGAWGSLVKARLDDVELRRGTNTITFRVDEPVTTAPPARFRFLLDELTLTPTAIGLMGVHLGDPAANLGTYRGAEPGNLRFSLNGHTPNTRTVSYAITDYFAKKAASGAATVAAGASSATVRLPDLPPGNYRVSASLGTGTPVAGQFAHLPAKKPVEGPANRFGIVTTSAAGNIPSSRYDSFAAAMKEMGAGYAREEISWPIAEPQRGHYDTRVYDRSARAFHRHGVKTLEFWGSFWGSAQSGQAPQWARTRASGPLPADLRDAYKFAHHLAGRANGVGRDALELWNEPDIDVTSTSGMGRGRGDQMAAYVKAAALGIADHANRPLIALPGLGYPGAFQDVMLRNDVVRYADIWNFHGYAEDYKPSGLSPPPTEPGIENALQRRYGPKTRVWMTEAGIFIPPTRGHDLTPAQQTDQARFLVQSSVQDLAAGTDKHFWFSGAPYCANGYACFGLLNREFQPWPSYSAHAAMTSILGEASFTAKVGNLPPNVSGYTFRNRGQTITVLWAGKTTQVKVPGAKAEVYDIMGRPKTTGGPADRVEVSLDPVYLVSGKANGPSVKPPPGHQRKRLSKAEHIVLSQRYDVAASAPPPPFGYRLAGRTRMSVDIYNFNDTAQTVTLSGRAYGGWSIRPARKNSVRIPAKGRASVSFIVTPGDKVKPGADYPLDFKGSLGGQPIPPSAARIYLKK